MLRYTLMIALHFMLRYMFQNSSVRVKIVFLFSGIRGYEINFCDHIVRPVNCSQILGVHSTWLEGTGSLCGPVQLGQAHHIHSKLTHSSVSRRCTHTSNRTKQQSN